MSQRSVLEIFDKLTSATYLLSDNQPSVKQLLEEAKAARAAIVELIKTENEYVRMQSHPIVDNTDMREATRVSRERERAFATFIGKA